MQSKLVCNRRHFLTLAVRILVPSLGGEYLQRQVKTLSAEGRLSVWILGGLPPGFMLYLGLANPSYLEPMYTTQLGWVMLTVMGVLLTAGIFWMKKVVKVDV